MSESNGNGVATESKASALTKLLKECEGKKANDTDRKAATKAFVAAMGERAKLEAALKAFDAKADETAIAMVRCYGAKHVTVAGVRYVPTSRGDRVYYKKMSDQVDTVALDG